MKKHVVIPFGVCLFLIVLSGFFFKGKYLRQVETRKELMVWYVSDTKTKLDVIMSRVRELPHIVKPILGRGELNQDIVGRYVENISLLEQFYIENNHFIKGISVYNNSGDVFSLYRDKKDSAFVQDIYRSRNISVLRPERVIAAINKSFSIFIPLHQNNNLTGNVEIDLDVASMQKELFKFCFEKGDLWPTSILDEETVLTFPLNNEWVLPYEKDMIQGVLDWKSGFFQGNIKGLGSSHKVVTYYESLKIPELCVGIAFSSNISPLFASSAFGFAVVSAILIVLTAVLSYILNRMIVRHQKAIDQKDRRINLLQTVYGNAPVAFIVYRNDSFFTANNYFFNLFDGIASLDDAGKVNFPFGFRREFEDWDICTFERNGKEVFLGRRQMDMKLDEDRFAIDAFWDITEMEQRLKDTVRSDIAKSELLNRVCADVKKTLSGIRDATALLTQQLPEEENITYVNKSTADLSGVIDMVQDYARIEAGCIVLDEIPFNLVDEIKKLTDRYHAEARQKGIELRAEISSSAIRNVVGDPLRFSQIINELLGNALKFTNEGSIRISLETAELQGRKIMVKCSVEDTGQGMAREKLKKLFSLDLRAKEEGEPIGLGVIITKKLVNMMGGSMRVTSPSPISTDPSVPGMQFSFSIICFSDHLSDKILDFSSIASYDQINVLIITSGSSQKHLTNFLNRKKINTDIYVYNKETEDLLIHKLIIDRNRYQIVVIAAANSEITFSIAEEIHRNDLTEHCICILVDIFSQKGNYIRAKSLDMDYYFVKSSDLSIYDSIFRTHFSHLSETGVSKAELVRKNLQILIAENNELSRNVVRIIFNKLGYEVDFAQDALHLVNQLNQKNYDIIFIDLKFPPSDGFEIAEMLRMKNYKMPIIAMTSTLTRDNIKNIADSNMDGYLSKPLNPDKIKQILVKWFV